MYTRAKKLCLVCVFLHKNQINKWGPPGTKVLSKHCYLYCFVSLLFLSLKSVLWSATLGDLKC